MRTLTDFIKSTPQLFGFVSGTTVAYAVFYNSSYFFVLGNEFSGVVSLADQVVWFLTSLPYTILTLAAGMYFDPPWVEDKKSSVPPDVEEKWKATSTWERNLPFFAVAGVAFVIAYKINAPGSTHIMHQHC